MPRSHCNRILSSDLCVKKKASFYLELTIVLIGSVCGCVWVGWACGNRNSRIVTDEENKPSNFPTCRLGANTQTVTGNIKPQSIHVPSSRRYRTTHIEAKWVRALGSKRAEWTYQKGDANYQISAMVFFFFCYFFGLLDFRVLEPYRNELSSSISYQLEKPSEHASRKLSTHCWSSQVPKFSSTNPI